MLGLYLHFSVPYVPHGDPWITEDKFSKSVSDNDMYSPMLPLTH